MLCCCFAQGDDSGEVNRVVGPRKLDVGLKFGSEDALTIKSGVPVSGSAAAAAACKLRNGSPLPDLPA